MPFRITVYQALIAGTKVVVQPVSVTPISKQLLGAVRISVVMAFVEACYTEALNGFLTDPFERRRWHAYAGDCLKTLDC